MRWLVVALLALVACAGANAADDEADFAFRCRYRPGFDSGQEIRLARVKPGEAGRSYFFRDDDEACPFDRGTCRRKAFVVPGDVVLVDRVSQGWACAWFAGPKGSTMGYLDASDLEFHTQEPPTLLADWLGKWERIPPVGAGEDKASIEFSRLGDGLGVVGSALWVGAPGENGSRMVNTGDLGDFDADWNAVPVGVRVTGATATLDAGKEDSCAATFRRLGPWVLVSDNMGCGGVNVSFGGAYRRVDGQTGGSR